MVNYICTICGHIVKEAKPEVCPICFADPTLFVEMNDENKHLYDHFTDLF